MANNDHDMEDNRIHLEEDVSRTPNALQRLLSTTADTKPAKVALLRDIKEDCIKLVSKYKKKYRKLKRIDAVLDISNSVLAGTSMMLIVGFPFPPFLAVSASLSGLSFVLGRVQDKVNYKAKLSSYNMTFVQYGDIARQITVVLAKNGMTAKEYHQYLQEVTDKISLLQEYQLF